MDKVVKEAMLSCTTDRFWVCMINDRILVSKRGVCAWKNKCGAARAFKESNFWIEASSRLNNSKYKHIVDGFYSKLLMDGTVRFIEVCPVPEKCC